MAFPDGFQHIVRENEPLADYTWLQIGGPARYICEPTSVDELSKVVRACHTNQHTIRVLGGGSNLLISEAGVDGVVLYLSAPAFCQMKVDGNRVICGGGAKLSHLVSMCVGAGLAGLECLVGIPGSVGGALCGNAGSMDGDIGDSLQSVTLMTREGQIVHKQSGDIIFSHRKSSLDELVLLEASFKLEPTDARYLTQRMQTLWILKRSSQPTGHARAIVPFVDPDTHSASELIEQAGMRGATEGLVHLSTEFPNFLLASAGATSEQVLALIERVRDAVFQRCGVQLQSRLAIW
jgi:UDP-N-acetylmuramate dehydrogenase